MGDERIGALAANRDEDFNSTRFVDLIFTRFTDNDVN